MTMKSGTARTLLRWHHRSRLDICISHVYNRAQSWIENAFFQYRLKLKTTTKKIMIHIEYNYFSSMNYYMRYVSSVDYIRFCFCVCVAVCE